MKPRFFATPEEFRAWLRDNHRTKTELLVGFYKKTTSRPSITWPESVDEALCVGWIDGVRKRLDNESYSIRFTPRKPQSAWSALNIRNMKRLLAEGRVLPAGLEAWERRSRKKSGYSYEQRQHARLDKSQLTRFQANVEAWRYFEAQAPSYKRTAIHWVVSAKRDETRARRLGTLIDCSARGEAVPPLRR